MIAKQAIVILQILILWLILYKIYKTSIIRDKRAPIDDIGVLFLLALSLYSTLPPISWLLQGGEYNLISGRLFQLQPDISEEGICIPNYCFIFLFNNNFTIHFW